MSKLDCFEILKQNFIINAIIVSCDDILLLLEYKVQNPLLDETDFAIKTFPLQMNPHY